MKKLRELLDEKLLKFIAVGVINTLVGMSIMFGLYNLAGCSYWVSSLTNYVLTSILSYFLNKYFTFGYKGHMARSAFQFAVNIGVCYFLAYGIAKPLTYWLLSGSSPKICDNVAMLVGMVFFTGFNYLGQRLFVFGGKEPEEPAKAEEPETPETSETPENPEDNKNITSR